MKAQQAKLLKIIEGFKNKKILLIGDPIFDIYIYGKALGISSETPTIVVEENETDVSFGGSSLLARNLLELGAKVTYIAVLGNDNESKLYDEFTHDNLKKHFIVDNSRKTTVKKRFWVDGYKLLQVDKLDNRDIDQHIVDDIINKIRLEIENHDAMIISDNRHGMMTDNLINAVREMSLKYNVNVFVDSQASQRESNIEKYRDFSFICINKDEAAQIDHQFSERESFENLKKKLGNSNICVKLGEKGSIAIVNNIVYRTRGITVESIDTCGAGDSFLSVLGLCEPDLPAESLFIANVWAGLSTTKHGVNPPEKRELVDYISR